MKGARHVSLSPPAQHVCVCRGTQVLRGGYIVAAHTRGPQWWMGGMGEGDNTHLHIRAHLRWPHNICDACKSRTRADRLRAHKVPTYPTSHLRRTARTATHEHAHADDQSVVAMRRASLRLALVAQRRATEHHDAYVTACFDDLALQALRARMPEPVVGTCEAGIDAARTLTPRFVIVTTDRRRRY